MIRKPLNSLLAVSVVLGAMLGSSVPARGQEKGEAGGDVEFVYEDLDSNPNVNEDAGGDANVFFEEPPPEVPGDSEPAGSAEKADVKNVNQEGN